MKAKATVFVIAALMSHTTGWALEPEVLYALPYNTEPNGIYMAFDERTRFTTGPSGATVNSSGDIAFVDHARTEGGGALPVVKVFDRRGVLRLQLTSFVADGPEASDFFDQLMSVHLTPSGRLYLRLGGAVTAVTTTGHLEWTKPLGGRFTRFVAMNDESFLAIDRNGKGMQFRPDGSIREVDTGDFMGPNPIAKGFEAVPSRTNPSRTVGLVRRADGAAIRLVFSDEPALDEIVEGVTVDELDCITNDRFVPANIRREHPNMGTIVSDVVVSRFLPNGTQVASLRLGGSPDIAAALVAPNGDVYHFQYESDRVWIVKYPLSRIHSGFVTYHRLPTLNKGGKTYVPLRMLANAHGKTVTWDPAKGVASIHASRTEPTHRAYIRTGELMKNGAHVWISRQAAERVGLNVSWDKKNVLAYVRTSGRSAQR